MTRRAKVNNLPARKPVGAVVHNMAGKHHLHSCGDCRRTFTCNCQTPEINGPCHVCRGTRRPVWETARDPKPCCVGNVAMVTRSDELARYDLAGPGPWFQCRTCARCHGYPVTTLEEA